MEGRPLITFALFAYNQENYIVDALNSALAQTYSPLEIIVSDDSSTDSTFSLIESELQKYHGQHKVILRKSEQNSGLSRCISEVCKLAQGRLILVAAGDDLSVPDRTMQTYLVWAKYGFGSGCLYSHFRTISDKGIIEDPKSIEEEKFITIKDRNLKALNGYAGISGCTQAWTKDLFELFGSIDDRIIHEDVIIPLRALLIGSIIFIPDTLVDYRIVQGSLSRKKYLNYKERFEIMEKYWTGRIAIFDQVKLDACKAVKNKLMKKDDYLWLLSEIKSADKYAKVMHSLQKAGLKARLKILFNLSTPLTFRQKLKWTTISLFPFVYNYRLRN